MSAPKFYTLSMRETLQKSGRLTGFDSLRFFMVLCVVMLHAAMTYMAFVPPWWYVIDSEKSLAFTILVVFLDSFPMSTLFFLAGYFAPPSCAKRGTRVFLKDKCMRIGVPWILGVLSVAPFFARASYIKFGLPDLGAWDFIRQQFFGPFYQQGHYWFLGVLLFFQAAYALAVKYFPARDAAKKFRSVQWIALLGLVTALAYWLSTRYLMPADNWLNIGYILYFQPARLVGYTSAFALGIAGWHMRWFTPGGWTPRVLQSGVFAAAAGCTLLCWRFIAAPGLSPGQNMLCDAILYTCVSVSMPFFLTAAALRTQDRFARIAKFFAPHSYSIYWLHQIVLMPVLYILLPLNIPIALKWLVSLPTTLAICRGISAVFLKRLPFF